MSANDFRLGGFSPALESADHFKIKKSYDLFIGGGVGQGVETNCHY